MDEGTFYSRFNGSLEALLDLAGPAGGVAWEKARTQFFFDQNKAPGEPFGHVVGRLVYGLDLAELQPLLPAATWAAVDEQAQYLAEMGRVMARYKQQVAEHHMQAGRARFRARVQGLPATAADYVAAAADNLDMAHEDLEDMVSDVFFCLANPSMAVPPSVAAGLARILMKTKTFEWTLAAALGCARHMCAQGDDGFWATLGASATAGLADAGPHPAWPTTQVAVVDRGWVQGAVDHYGTQGAVEAELAVRMHAVVELVRMSIPAPVVKLASMWQR